MASDDVNIDDKEVPLTGIPLARRFYEISREEFGTGDRERMKDGCEKGYRAALEALDTLLTIRGYRIDAGRPAAHQQRSKALVDLVAIDPRFKRIRNMYNTFSMELHGQGFYSNMDPKLFKQILEEVEEFIEIIEQLVTH